MKWRMGVHFLICIHLGYSLFANLMHTVDTLNVLTFLPNEITESVFTVVPFITLITYHKAFDCFFFPVKSTVVEYLHKIFCLCCGC